MNRQLVDSPPNADLKRAQRLLLKHAPTKQAIASAELIARVEAAAPTVSGDTIRYAYWNLVGLGRLERVDAGVRRGSAG